MKILSSIPNLITAANLMCGVFGIKFLMDTFAGGCLESNLNSIKKAACFVIVGAFLDLFDGLLARILKVDSKIGKYLDSLADLITFGVLPSFILYSLSTFGLQMFYAKSLNNFEIIKLGPLLLPIFTAYRLARFNTINDSEYFTGLSSTAVGIFTSLLAIMSGNKNSKVLQGIILDPYIILFLSLFLSLLMVSNVKFFSLKFKTLSPKDNYFRYIIILTFIILSSIYYINGLMISLCLYIFLGILNELWRILCQFLG